MKDFTYCNHILLCIADQPNENHLKNDSKIAFSEVSKKWWLKSAMIYSLLLSEERIQTCVFPLAYTSALNCGKFCDPVFATVRF